MGSANPRRSSPHDTGQSSTGKVADYSRTLGCATGRLGARRNAHRAALRSAALPSEVFRLLQ